MRRSGIGGVVAVVILLALLVWGVAIMLHVLAVAIPLAAGVFALLLALHGWREHWRHRAVEETGQQIAEMAREAAAHLDELAGRWDYAMFTKGIGTPLQSRDPDEVAREREELSAARALLDAAPTTPYRIEAIINAERVRVRLRRHLR